jgi:hypothetical protein
MLRTVPNDLGIYLATEEGNSRVKNKNNFDPEISQIVKVDNAEKEEKKIDHLSRNCPSFK